MEPDGADCHYTERLVRLPNLGFAYAPHYATNEGPSEAAARAEHSSGGRLEIDKDEARFRNLGGDPGEDVVVLRQIFVRRLAAPIERGSEEWNGLAKSANDNVA